MFKYTKTGSYSCNLRYAQTPNQPKFKQGLKSFKGLVLVDEMS